MARKLYVQEIVWPGKCMARKWYGQEIAWPGNCVFRKVRPGNCSVQEMTGNPYTYTKTITNQCRPKREYSDVLSILSSSLSCQ